MKSPLSYFSELRDPRVERTREHLLEEILLMALAAVLSGAGSWNEIEGYCNQVLVAEEFLEVAGRHTLAQMSDNLDRYLPEFDEEETRAKLVGLTREQLIEMLIYDYKLKRVIAKSWDEDGRKLRQIADIIAEPSALLGMPGVPTADDLRRMTEDEDGNATAE